MKLTAGKAEAFLKSPNESVRAILLFGPDSGLASERAKNLLARFSDDEDPFGITQLNAEALKKDGAVLADSSNAMSLMGSKPVIHVRDATDGIVGIVQDWLNAGAGMQPAVFEAGELSPRSKLRSLFEKRDDAAAIGCYADAGRDLAGIIREHMANNGVSISRDALPVLVQRLGTDRLAIRQELDKLVMYAGGPGSETEISIQDVEECCGDIKAASLDDIAFAVAGGDQQRFGISFERAISEGVTIHAILRAVQRHFDRLHQVNAAAAESGSVADAVKRLRPPVFYKEVDAMVSQGNRWSVDDLGRGLRLLIQTERECKSGINIDRALCERALIQLTQAARRAH